MCTGEKRTLCQRCDRPVSRGDEARVKTKVTPIRSLLKRRDENTQASRSLFVVADASVGVAYLFGVAVAVVIVTLRCRVRCNID